MNAQPAGMSAVPSTAAPQLAEAVMSLTGQIQTSPEFSSLPIITRLRQSNLFAKLMEPARYMVACITDA